MSEPAFFDTNILLYCYDAGAPKKRDVALALVEEYFAAKLGRLSTQVLQEFFVAVTGRTKLLNVTEAARHVGAYSALEGLVVITPEHILEAAKIHARWSVSFWDGLILAASKACGAKVLYSEDMAHGQRIGGVRIVNPFLLM